MASSSAPRRGRASVAFGLGGLKSWPAGSAGLPTVLPLRAGYSRVTQSHASPTRASESGPEPTRLEGLRIGSPSQTGALGDGDGGTSVLDRFHLVSHVHVRLALDAAALHRATQPLTGVLLRTGDDDAASPLPRTESSNRGLRQTQPGSMATGGEKTLALKPPRPRRRGRSVLATVDPELSQVKASYGAAPLDAADISRTPICCQVIKGEAAEQQIPARPRSAPRGTPGTARGRCYRDPGPARRGSCTSGPSPGTGRTAACRFRARRARPPTPRADDQ
jgi:hypothetical protein